MRAEVSWCAGGRICVNRRAPAAHATIQRNYQWKGPQEPWSRHAAGAQHERASRRPPAARRPLQGRVAMPVGLRPGCAHTVRPCEGRGGRAAGLRRSRVVAGVVARARGAGAVLSARRAALPHGRLGGPASISGRCGSIGDSRDAAGRSCVAAAARSTAAPALNHACAMYTWFLASVQRLSSTHFFLPGLTLQKSQS